MSEKSKLSARTSNVFVLLMVACILMVFSNVISASETIHVKDYIQGKLSPIFSFYLSSLEELDQYEKEFIDLLAELPKEQQMYYAKEVFRNGFSLELLNNIKEEHQMIQESNKERFQVDFAKPLDNYENNISQRFGEYLGYYGGKYYNGFHSAEDIGAVVGTPVKSIASGTVVKISDLGTLGKLIAIEHTDGPYLIPGRSDEQHGQNYSYLTEKVDKVYSIYVHVDPVVEENTLVEKGDEIAVISAIPRPHLHFEIRHPEQDHSNDWSMVGGSDNWSTFANGKYNGYYKNLQKMIDGGVRHPSDFLGLVLPPSTTLPAPTIISPGAEDPPGQVIDTLTPTLKWNEVSEAAHYSLAVSKDPYGTENIIYESGNITGTAHTVPNGKLESGYKYRWNMQAGNSAGWSPVSNTLYFQIRIQEEAKNLAVAIVMDRSGSMSGEKLTKARHAADGFIANLHPDEYSCLVTFADSANTMIELLQTSPENKRKFQVAIDTVDSGGQTNIGDGLTHGLQQLARAAEPTSQTALLMSDGMHNTGELWPVVDKYEQKGWPVYTVAYGRDADQKTLDEIAMRTGGIFFPADIYNISQIYQRISAQTRHQSVLFAYNDMIAQGKKLDYQIPIDPDITSATFFVDWQGSVVDLHLQTPEEEILSPDNFHNFPGVDYQTGDTFCFYQVDEPIPGDWQATLYGKEIDRESEQVNLTVSGSSPLLANIFGLQPSYRRNEALQIKVKVLGLFSSEPESLRDVKVTANIKKPSPNLKKMLQKRKIDLGQFFQYALTKKKTLTLHDDGRHNDWRADDGIFGAVYTDTDENGHYVITVKCEAQKPDGEKIIRILQESVQVGPVEVRTVTLADFLGIKN